MTKKKTAGLALAAMCAGLALLAGCSKGGGGSASGSSNVPQSSAAASVAGATEGRNTFVEGGTPLSLWTFQELHVGFYIYMADKWNEEHPDRPINLTVTVGGGSAMHNRLLIACQAGQGTPDIADVEIGAYATFLRDSYFLPLNDVVEPYKNDIVMSRIEMYGDGTGNYYGIDFHLGATVTYYNMDIMNDAGVDPASIVTWNDYFEAGKVVLETTGKPMVAVETGDVYLPQLMLLEKGGQWIDADGKPNIATQENAEVIDFIRQMLDAGVCILAPGGGVHSEEWYGFLNGSNIASISMPLWYMGRFTDYCPDLAGKMAIYELPVWNEGDVREVLQGGTGTSVVKYTQNEQLAKDFLAFAKLSEQGNRYEWEILGFDPIRTSLWTDPSITQNPDNKYLKYFLTNPFDILVKNGSVGLAAPDIRGAFAAVVATVNSTTFINAFELQRGTDAMQLLRDEQASIIY